MGLPARPRLSCSSVPKMKRPRREHHVWAFGSVRDGRKGVPCPSFLDHNLDKWSTMARAYRVPWGRSHQRCRFRRGFARGGREQRQLDWLVDSARSAGLDGGFPGAARTAELVMENRPSARTSGSASAAAVLELCSRTNTARCRSILVRRISRSRPTMGRSSPARITPSPSAAIRQSSFARRARGERSCRLRRRPAVSNFSQLVSA